MARPLRVGDIVKVLAPGAKRSKLLRLNQEPIVHGGGHVRLVGMRLRQSDHAGLGVTSVYVPAECAWRVSP